MEQYRLTEEFLDRLKEQILDELDYIGRGVQPVIQSEFVKKNYEENTYQCLYWTLDYENNKDEFEIPIDVYKEIIDVKVKSPNPYHFKDNLDKRFDYDLEHKIESFKINDESLPKELRKSINDYIISNCDRESVGIIEIDYEYSKEKFKHHSKEISRYIFECIEEYKKQLEKLEEIEKSKRRKYTLYKKDDPQSLVTESSISDSFIQMIGKGAVIVNGKNNDTSSSGYLEIHGFMKRIEKIRTTNEVLEVCGVFAGEEISTILTFFIFDIEKEIAINLINSTNLKVGIYISKTKTIEVIDMIYDEP